MKPIPLIVSLGLVSGMILSGTTLSIAQEAVERPLPENTPSSPEFESGVAPDFSAPSRPSVRPRPEMRSDTDINEVPIMDQGTIPQPGMDSDGTTSFPTNVEPISMPLNSRQITRETLDQRRAEIQQMREQKQLTRCQIFETQLANVASVRLSQNARIADRYMAVIDRLEAIVAWLETQEVDTTQFQVQIEELKEQQQEYLRLSEEYATSMRELPAQCSGEEFSLEERQALEGVRQTARDLAATNAELRRSIRDDVLTPLRALNL